MGVFLGVLFLYKKRKLLLHKALTSVFHSGPGTIQKNPLIFKQLSDFQPRGEAELAVYGFLVFTVLCTVLPAIETVHGILLPNP